MTDKKSLIEIDLKELFWSLLAQWKALLLAAIIMAVLIAGVQYKKDIRAYDEAVKNFKAAEEQKKLSKTERFSLVLENIPAGEQALVKYVVNEKLWISQQKDYLEKSILMKTDANNQRLLTISYDIKADDPGNVPIIMQCLDLQLSNPEIIESLREIISPETDNKYIEELFYNAESEVEDSYSADNDSVLLVNIILPEETEADAVASVIKEAIEKKSSAIKGEYPHVLLPAGSGTTHFHNIALAEEHRDAINNINDIEEALKNTEAGMTEEQKEAVDKIISVLTESGDEAISEESEPSKPGINKKYALMGFVLGICIYVFIYILWLITRRKLHSARTAEDIFDARTLGEIYLKPESRKRNGLLRSEAVIKHQYGEKLDVEKQIYKAVESIDAVSEYLGVREITIINSMDTAKENDIYNTIKTIEDDLRSKNIETRHFDLSDIAEEKNLHSAKIIIPAVGKLSGLADLEKIKRLCSEYDIKIPGSIFVAEV